MELTMHERKPIYRETAKEYQRARKKEKKAILDRFVQTTGLDRKYAATLLRYHGKTVRVRKRTELKADIGKSAKPGGRKLVYDEAVQKTLKKIWPVSGYLCGKRLNPAMGGILDNLKRNGKLKCKTEVEDKLRRMSASTMDRILKAERKRLELKGRRGTKPGTLLKHQIAVRTHADWKEDMPGFFEIDLVQHEGGNARGDFAYTLDMVDVFSGWAENRAILNKASLWVRKSIDFTERRLPFQLLGLDSDTGSEFINYPMKEYCEAKAIKFTRGRSSRSNDNCYVEQKNYSIVRAHVGYARYEGEEDVYWLNRLYGSLRLYTNFFQPVMKMTEKTREGSKVKKKYGDIQTPYQRLMGCDKLDDVRKARLKAIYDNLDLMTIVQEMEHCKKTILWLHKQRNLGEGINFDSISQ